MRATKLIKSIAHLSYIERLKFFNLPTLKYRRLRGDMIEVYKILTGNYDKDSCLKLTTSHLTFTRGNCYKLENARSRYDIRKYFFTNRVVNTWNSLPDIVVTANTVDCFKDRLDRFWSNQDLYYDWEGSLLGTGNISLV